MINKKFSLTLASVRKTGIDWREISRLFKLMIVLMSAYRNSPRRGDQNPAVMVLTHPVFGLLT